MYLLFAEQTDQIAQQAAEMAVKANQFSPGTIIGIIGTAVVALMGILTANFLGMRNIMKNSDKRVDTQQKYIENTHTEAIKGYIDREERHYKILEQSFAVQRDSNDSNRTLATAIDKMGDSVDKMCVSQDKMADKVDNVQCLNWQQKTTAVHIDNINVEQQKKLP